MDLFCIKNKWPINQFKHVWQSSQYKPKAYCPNLFTLMKGSLWLTFCSSISSWRNPWFWWVVMIVAWPHLWNNVKHSQGKIYLCDVLIFLIKSVQVELLFHKICNLIGKNLYIFSCLCSTSLVMLRIYSRPKDPTF